MSRGNWLIGCVPLRGDSPSDWPSTQGCCSSVIAGANEKDLVAPLRSSCAKVIWPTIQMCRSRKSQKSNLALSQSNANGDIDCVAIEEDTEASADDKERNTFRPFDYFLGFCCRQNSLEFEPDVSIGYGGLKCGGRRTTSRDNASIQEFWEELILNFLNCPGEQARQHCGKSKPLIVFWSASGHASSVKTFHCRQFNCQPPLKIYFDEKWKSLRGTLEKKFTNWSKLTGELKVQGHQASDEGDRRAINAACVLTGSLGFTEFMQVQKDANHLSGHGSKFSLQEQTRRIIV